MTASALINDRLIIEETTLEELKSLQTLEAASFRVADEHGRPVPLSRDVQRLISLRSWLLSRSEGKSQSLAFLRSSPVQ